MARILEPVRRSSFSEPPDPSRVNNVQPSHTMLMESLAQLRNSLPPGASQQHRVRSRRPSAALTYPAEEGQTLDNIIGTAAASHRRPSVSNMPSSAGRDRRPSMEHQDSQTSVRSRPPLTSGGESGHSIDRIRSIERMRRLSASTHVSLSLQHKPEKQRRPSEPALLEADRARRGKKVRAAMPAAAAAAPPIPSPF